MTNSILTLFALALWLPLIATPAPKPDNGTIPPAEIIRQLPAPTPTPMPEICRENGQWVKCEVTGDV